MITSIYLIFFQANQPFHLQWNPQQVRKRHRYSECTFSFVRIIMLSKKIGYQSHFIIFFSTGQSIHLSSWINANGVWQIWQWLWRNQLQDWCCAARQQNLKCWSNNSETIWWSRILQIWTSELYDHPDSRSTSKWYVCFHQSERSKISIILVQIWLNYVITIHSKSSIIYIISLNAIYKEIKCR